MIAVLILQAAAAATAPAPPAVAPPAVSLPGTLPRQAMPAKGCAVYLWSAEDRRLVAMATAETPTLRLMLDGRAVDLPRGEQLGSAGFGFADSTTYRDGTVTATLALQVATRTDLIDGAIVPAATLTIARAGGDALVLPVGGLIGCAKTAAP